MQQPCEEIGVIVKGVRIGYILEDEARELIRSGAYTMVRRHSKAKRGERLIRLVEESHENVIKARALCNSSSRAALSTTQREELYQGLRRPGHGLTPTDGPVTRVITVVRKYRAGVGFMNWGETEKFARRRFNPDKIAQPRFRTEAEFHAFRAQQSASKAA